MGDSRSWGAEMEDEDTTCQFGVITKYFDPCTCPGCITIKERNHRIRNRAHEIGDIAAKIFRETPDDKWHLITSIKIK